MNDRQTNPMVSEASASREVRQLRETPELLQKPLHRVRQHSEKAYAASAGIGLVSDNGHSKAREVDDKLHILCQTGPFLPLQSAQDGPQSGANELHSSQPCEFFELSDHFQVFCSEPDGAGNDSLFGHSDCNKLAGYPTRTNSPKVLQASPEYSGGIARQPISRNDGKTDLSPNVSSPKPVRFSGLQALYVVGDEFRSSALALPSLQSAWEYLSRQQAAEINPHAIDDLRIAQLCLLNVERGQADPWRFAFWTYMGITPEKWLGIRAEREAYERTLGPTLADQLQDPTFLSTLDPFARQFYLRPHQISMFPPQPVPSPKRKRRTA